MRLSRTDLAAPALAIIAGGAIGGLLALSPIVLWSPSGDVPAPDPVVVPSAPTTAPASSGPASGFDLQQNYPNPFNPETTIPFVLRPELFAEGRPAVVSIHIFNQLQQLVASPVVLGHSSGEGTELIQLEYTQPGRYEAFWDGTDESGRQVASGVYFIRLIVNGLPQMRRGHRQRIQLPYWTPASFR